MANIHSLIKFNNIDDCLDKQKIIANEANFKLIDNHFVYTGLCKKCK